MIENLNLMSVEFQTSAHCLEAIVLRFGGESSAPGDGNPPFATFVIQVTPTGVRIHNDDSAMVFNPSASSALIGWIDWANNALRTAAANVIPKYYRGPHPGTGQPR